MTAIVLTVAGSDPSGGAGLQADLKTFAALGAYGASVVTALTAQNTTGVQGVHDVPAAFIARQIDSVFSDLAVNAVKIGMLSRVAAIEAVAEALSRHGARNIVLDPVMVATSGDNLLAPDAVEALRQLALPLADLLTPNLPEAAALLAEPLAGDETAMEDQARRLLALGPRAVLLKGGHAGGPESVDVLVTAAETRRFAAPRVPTRHTHGTGCTLSSAVAAGLARGLALAEAAAAAKDYVTAAIAAAERIRVGGGSGPVHHFHAWWDASSSLGPLPRP